MGLSLSETQARKENTMSRKVRNDKGSKRGKYNNKMPPDYLSVLRACAAKGEGLNLKPDEVGQILKAPCSICEAPSSRIYPLEGYNVGECMACCDTCYGTLKNFPSVDAYLKYIKSTYLSLKRRDFI
jgi:hypothetical protein